MTQNQQQNQLEMQICPSTHQPNTQYIQLNHDQNESNASNSRINMHIDEMIENSFLATGQIRLKSKNQPVIQIQNSGESFFARSKNNCFSEIEIGASNMQKMKHKKLQCEISSGDHCIQGSKRILDKVRRLQILKIIKLVKALFKFLRFSKQSIYKLLEEEKEANAILFSDMKFQLKTNLKQVQKLLKDKDSQIQYLQSQNLRYSQLYTNLSMKIQQDLTSSKNSMKQIYQQQHKKIQALIKESQDMQVKHQQLLQKNNSLQNIIHTLEIELSNVQHQNQNNQILVKKLEYQNTKLQEEAKYLAQRLQKVLNYNEQHQISQQQQDEVFLNNYAQLKSIKTLNELYLKEIELNNKQLSLMRQQNYKLQAQREQVLNMQLNRYQECFRDEVEKIKRQMKEEIDRKDKIIEQMKYQERVYISNLLNLQGQRQIGKINKLSAQKIPKYEKEKISFTSSFLSKKQRKPSAMNVGNSSSKTLPKNSKTSIIQQQSPDNYIKTSRNIQSKFSISIHDSEKQLNLKDTQEQQYKNGYYIADRQYMTQVDCFKLNNGQNNLKNIPKLINKGNFSHGNNELFREKMSNIQYKLIKLNKSLDYRTQTSWQSQSNY